MYRVANNTVAWREFAVPTSARVRAFHAHGVALNRPSGLRIGLAAAAIAAAACLRLGGRLL